MQEQLQILIHIIAECCFFYRTACLYTWLESVESIYFYLGPQKGFWVVKLPRKQVGAIMKASYAENRLTILEIVVEIQPDQTPSMNRVKLQVSHLTHKWQ